MRLPRAESPSHSGARPSDVKLTVARSLKLQYKNDKRVELKRHGETLRGKAENKALHDRLFREYDAIVADGGEAYRFIVEDYDRRKKAAVDSL